MEAHAMALPVLERLAGEPQPGRVLGAGRHAAHVEFAGFVVTITARGVPLMPNGIAVTERRPAWPPAGAAVTAHPGRLASGGAWRVTWPAAEPPAWDPTLPQLATVGAFQSHSGHHAPIGRLAEAAATRDPALAARAAAELCGRGPGLTPEGDDLLVGAAAAVWAAALACGWTAPERTAWLAALVLPDLRARTTALSATLLELAVRGAVLEPVHGLLAPGEARRLAALARLLRIGHSTGPAYAAAVAGTLAALPITSRP